MSHKIPFLVVGLASLGMFSVGAVGCTAADSAPGRDPNPVPTPQPIDQATSSVKSARYAGDVTRQVKALAEFATAEDGVLRRLGGQVFGAKRSAPAARALATLLPAPLPRPLLDQFSDTPAWKSLRPRPSFLALATEEENVEMTADDVEAFIKTRLLVASNVEFSTSTSVTYLLAGDPTCRPLPSRRLMQREPSVDMACSEDLGKLQVRIVATSDGDGYRFRVLIGPDRHELSVFVIHSDLVAWEADLNMARQATDYISTTLDGANEPSPFQKLQGRVQVAVLKLGEKKARIGWSVLEPIDIQDQDNQSLTMAKSDPLFALTGDAVAKTLGISLAIPQTDLRGPWDPRDMGARNSDLHASIGGLHGQSTLSEMAEELAFTGLGVGASFVEVRGSKIFELGWNPQNANKMDLKIKPIAGDQARFQLSPRLDLSLAFKLGMVAADFRDGPPDYLENETYSLTLMNGSPIEVETVAGNNSGFDGGFKMVAGTLTLSTSSAAAATVNVPMGQCLTGKDKPADGAHPILGGLQAVSCP